MKWIGEWKKELEGLEHPDNHTPRYCGDDVLELIAEIERLEKEKEEIREDLNAKKRFWKGKYAELFSEPVTHEIARENTQLLAIVEKAEAVDWDIVIAQIDIVAYRHPTENGRMELKILRDKIEQLQQALQAAKEGE